jgi:Domain of unknown function (DUF4160)
MTTVRVEGVYFRLYPADHGPRHVHGNYGETIAIVDLLDGGAVALANRVDRVIPANAKRSDVNKILNLAKRHFNELVSAWEKMH